ncbi:GlsB/YeaQ/YmgE family stress response membrane protein [Ciceribacter sp. RN22]|uniref:GlsB/YeaQ/YmgE family stress response membrane protein n=1 Tax=Ciceribacter sp. RN22 TaxID=2954932 RepID=UPI0020934B1D|nr:GlsB/YeaQ/YmgE family stress response membrane protein [Ciceribacter sp. RN22]MCO6180997.1 GlsB/YeaQ/YmgE family stress response membrane protein [Ciceribacter sp. RN22]
MDVQGLIILLLVGLVAGWLASQLVRGGGFGIIGDLVVGVVGALLAGLLFPALGLGIGGGILGSIIAATVGAIILLFLLRLVRQG